LNEFWKNHGHFHEIRQYVEFPSAKFWRLKASLQVLSLNRLSANAFRHFANNAAWHIVAGVAMEVGCKCWG